MSLTDKLNEISRDELVSLRKIKRLKEREIKALFIFIGKFIKNIIDSAIQVKTDLEQRINNLRDNGIATKAELELKMQGLEDRIKVLEDAKR